ASPPQKKWRKVATLGAKKASRPIRAVLLGHIAGFPWLGQRADVRSVAWLVGPEMARQHPRQREVGRRQVGELHPAKYAVTLAERRFPLLLIVRRRGHAAVLARLLVEHAQEVAVAVATLAFPD